MNRVAVVIPNWDGEDIIAACLLSLKKQSLPHTVIVVDNGSVDRSVNIIDEQFPGVILLKQPRNYGFAKGVNIGIRYAMKHGFAFAALLNNDAVVDRLWLEKMLDTAKSSNKVGSVMSKIVSYDKKYLDGTGEVYTSWGIHYPRGRGEKPGSQYDNSTKIFGASGGASLFRIKALEEVGLFDQDFFAYYEDIDLAWRLQLAGWQAAYSPSAVAYHHISVSGKRVKGFTTYQTLKNIPWVVWKNIPLRLIVHVLPRFTLAYLSFIASGLQRGHFLPVLKGVTMSLLLLPKKLFQRFGIQRRRKVPISYLGDLIVWDLPPDQTRLRALRKRFTGRD